MRTIEKKHLVCVPPGMGRLSIGMKWIDWSFWYVMTFFINKIKFVAQSQFLLQSIVYHRKFPMWFISWCYSYNCLLLENSFKLLNIVLNFTITTVVHNVKMYVDCYKTLKPAVQWLMFAWPFFSSVHWSYEYWIVYTV